MRGRMTSAAAAAVLILGLAPGIAWAAIPGTLDQSTDTSPNSFLVVAPTTQTFTAGLSGYLTHVEIYCWTSGASQSATVTVESSTSLPATCTGTHAWADFVFPSPPEITAFDTYTIDFTPGGQIAIGLSTFDYPGGIPAGITSFTVDFSFRTYVYSVTSTHEYVWNPDAVAPNASVPAMLTITASFEAIPLTFTAGPTYSLQVTMLPSWFATIDATCSSQIAEVDCTPADLLAGVPVTGDGSAMTVTATVFGALAPGSLPSGTMGAAMGEACVGASGEGITIDVCDSAGATVFVDAAAATPPPTSVMGSPATPSGSPSVWLLAGLLGAIGSLFVAAKRASVKA